MGIIVVRPAGWGANSSQSCRSCSFKSFDVRARFGTIDSASKTKKYLLKNSTIRNRLLFPELQTLNLLVPKIRTGGSFYLIVIYFWNSKTIFTAEFWATFSYGLLLQRFFWNSSGIFIISIKADTRNFSKKYQQNFLLDAIFFEQ